jgi:hypothetical protein
MKKTWIIILSILVVLVAIRLILPFAIIKYVNKTLDNIPGYKGSIEDVDLNLYRGAYIIENVVLQKLEGDVPRPFIKIDSLDLSVEWKALFDGAIVGEVILRNPELNFVAGPGDSTQQDGTEADWTKPLEELMPLEINRFEITDGKVTYLDEFTSPKVDVFIDSLFLEALNLRNTKDTTDSLPSTLKVRGISIGNGKLSLDAKVDILKQIPDFDAELKFEGVDLTKLNDFSNAYINVDFEAGTFNLYSEMAADSGYLQGYVKPLMENVKVLDLEKEEEDKFFKKVWEGVVGFVTEIFENQKEDQFATKIPLQGNLNNPDAGIWPTIWNIFSNAFIEAFNKDIDNTINASDNG